MKLRKPRPITDQHLSSLRSDRPTSSYPSSVTSESETPWASTIRTDNAGKSRTLQYAEQSNTSSSRYSLWGIGEQSSCRDVQKVPSRWTVERPTLNIAGPSTKSEMYWAGRALIAETQVMERNRSESQLEHTRLGHEERVTRLERFVITLTALLALITIVLLFRSGDGGGSDRMMKPGAAFRPHLTIPLFSPFTTIVEHEMSKMNFRTIALLIVVSAFVIYRLVCRWLDRP